MKTGRRRTLTGEPEVAMGNQFPATSVKRTGISHENARVRGGMQGIEMLGMLEADRWRRFPNPWQQYRK